MNCCWQNGFIGLSGYGGGLSEHLVVPEYTLYHCPDNVGLDVAGKHSSNVPWSNVTNRTREALVEPLAVGWHAVASSPFTENDSVLVLGGGPIGLSVIQSLRARRCRQIVGAVRTFSDNFAADMLAGSKIVSEISGMRKEFAKDFGAHVVLDPTQDDIVKECLKLTNNKGVDVTFDAAGVQAGLDQAINSLKARGKQACPKAIGSIWCMLIVCRDPHQHSYLAKSSVFLAERFGLQGKKVSRCRDLHGQRFPGCD